MLAEEADAPTGNIERTITNSLSLYFITIQVSLYKDDKDSFKL